MDGLETLARIQEIPFADRPEVVIISGHGTIETAVKATKLGAFDFLEKPLTIEKVTVVLNNAVQQRRLELELNRLKESGDAKLRIIGESVPMKALRQQLALMAATNGRVLIFGESGTGKELIAHAIHAASPRASRSLRRSELRGDSRRADRKRVVRPSQGQPRRRARRQDRQTAEGRRRHAVSRRSRRHVAQDAGQGAARARRAALRARGRGRIDSSGRARGGLHQQESGRRDRARQFSRGSVLPPERDSVPRPSAARAHRGRAPAGGSFPARIHHRLRPQAQGVDRGCASACSKNIPWPGNVRELRNLMERIVIMNPQTGIDARHIPLDRSRRAVFDRPMERFGSLQDVREAAERDYILKKLEEAKGNVTRAAEMLGLERSHLYRKMKALGIAPKE